MVVHSRPAVNSSESPGRKKPDEQAGLGEEHEEDPERAEARQQAVRVERVQRDDRSGRGGCVEWRSMVWSFATSGSR